MNDTARFALDVLSGFGSGDQAKVVELHIKQQDRTISALVSVLHDALEDRRGWRTIAGVAISVAKQLHPSAGVAISGKSE